MSSVKKFELVLENQIYYAGQVITGSIVLELKKTTKIKEIRININGDGLVRWTLHRTIYRGTAQYLGLTTRIFGNGIEATELSVGKHVFYFEFQLPINLPSSYRDRTGRIGYSVKAEICQPWRFNVTRKQAITVMSIFDLNVSPSALMPISASGTKTFLGHSGELSMSVNMPISGFVSGQIVPIRVSINNQSDIPVESIVATLIQRTKYYVNQHSASRSIEIVEKVVPLENGVGSKCVYLNLEVPALIPSNIGHFTRLMELKYFIVVEAKVGLFRFNLSIDREINIGNIPVFMFQQPISREQQLPTDSDYAVELPQLASYGDFAPPVFKKCEAAKLCCFVRTTPEPMCPVYTFEKRARWA